MHRTCSALLGSWSRPLALALALAPVGCTSDDGGSATEASTTSTSTATSEASTSTSGGETETESGTSGAVDDSGGRLVEFGGECKMMEGAAPDQECMAYSFVGGVLTIEHKNLAANCCVKGLEATFTVVQGVSVGAVVKEAPGYEPCDCNCLFDAEYAFDAIEPGTYQVIVAGPITPAGDPPLGAVLNLASTPIGEVCSPRTSYPWG